MGQSASRDAYLKGMEQIKEQIVPADSDIWNILLSQNVDEETIIPTIKKLVNERPENLATLLKKIVEYLNKIKGVQRQSNTATDFQNTNSCLDLLSRIMPFIFESTTDFNERVFWSNKPPSPPIVVQPPPPTTSTTSEQPSTTTTATSETTSGDQQQQQQKPDQPVQPVQEQQTQETVKVEEETIHQQHELDSSPLAIKLMDCLLELLFLPNYTVDQSLMGTAGTHPREEHPDSLPTTFTWMPGFGVETVPTVTNKQICINRMHVLQCLLSCLSEQLYITQEQSSSFKSKWLDWTTKQEYYTEALFYSLINSFCNYDPIGWGVPYNHLVFADDQESVSKLAIQVLNILLSYDVDDIVENQYILFLKTLKRARDFKYFFTSFERILGLPLLASHTKLPYSTKKIDLHQDLLVTFWKFISINHEFLTFVTTYETSPEFLVHLLQYMDEGRKNQTTHGIMQIGTFILLVLSGERDFAISLNKHFTAKLYIDIPQPQVFADFVILVMYRLLVDTNDRLESIYECILTVLSNLSPYMKNLSMSACVKLMRLFEYLSSPRFLFSNSHNHRYVGLLLESFNNLLQHQYESNTRLLYAILRCQNQFSKLAYLKITPVTPKTKEEPSTDDMSKLSLSSELPTSSSSQHINEQNKSTSQSNPTTEHPVVEDQPQQQQPPPLPQEEQVKEEETTTTSTTTTTTTTTTATPNIKTTPTIKAISTTQIESNSENRPLTPPKRTQMVQQFIPTDEWLQEIKKHLPLENILKIITNLSPQIQGLCTGSGSDEQKIMEYLKISTIVGLFPASGPIMTRKYHPNAITKAWFLAYMWCIIYLENYSPPLFLYTQIKLFQVKY
eukprot:gene1207-1523_t